MSDTTALTDLARFVGQSQAAGESAAVTGAVAGNGAIQFRPRAAKRGVGDLLGVVLTLSARTRRSMMPHVEIELDVFSPNGERAVRLLTARR